MEYCLAAACRLPLRTLEEISVGMHVPDCPPAKEDAVKRGKLLIFPSSKTAMDRHVEAVRARGRRLLSSTSVLLTRGEKS